MRIANEPQLSAIMAKSNIQGLPCAWIAGLELALGQEPGGLSDEEQRAEAIQNYIQHDPFPWGLRSRVRSRDASRRRR